MHWGPTTWSFFFLVEEPAGIGGGPSGGGGPVSTIILRRPASIARARSRIFKALEAILAGSEWYLTAMAYMESQVGVIVFVVVVFRV